LLLYTVGMQFWAFPGILALTASVCFAQQAQASDEEIWTEFAAFVQQLKPLPPGQSVPGRTRYVAALTAHGVPEAEAARRFERVNVLRRESVDREKIYWNASFKSGGGPSSPLRLLQEALYKVKPGRALDAGMGRGRNAIFLAATGWDATGYDMSPDALQAARAEAAAAGVKITTIESKHDDFPFGVDQWDLIVCAYCYMLPEDGKWPSVFLRGLRAGGMVVFQTSVSGKPSWQQLSENWSGFHILRLEDLDAGIIDDDWAPSRSHRTIRLVARKE
jgi:SAM-dependent methyltransferase